MNSELGRDDTSVGDGIAICARNLDKVYKLYDRSIDRLKELDQRGVALGDAAHREAAATQES